MMEQKPQKGHKPSLLARVYKTDDDWLQGICEQGKLKSKAEALALIYKHYEDTQESRVSDRFSEIRHLFGDEDIRGSIEIMRVIVIKAMKYPETRKGIKERLEKVL